MASNALRARHVSYTLVTCMCDTRDTYQEQYVYSHKWPKSNPCIVHTRHVYV